VSGGLEPVSVGLFQGSRVGQEGVEGELREFVFSFS